MSVRDSSPFMGIYAYFKRVVSFNSVVWYAVRRPIREHPKGFLQTAVERVDIHAVDHIGWIMFGVLHDRLTDCRLMPR